MLSYQYLQCEYYVYVHDVILFCYSHDNPAVGLPTPHRQLTWLYLCYVNMQLLFFPNWLCADWTMGTVPVIRSLADPRNLATLATFLALALLSLHALFRKWLENHIHGIVHDAVASFYIFCCCVGTIIIGISIPSCLQSLLPCWICSGRTDTVCPQYGLLCIGLLWNEYHQ